MDGRRKTREPRELPSAEVEFRDASETRADIPEMPAGQAPPAETCDCPPGCVGLPCCT